MQSRLPTSAAYTRWRRIMVELEESGIINSFLISHLLSIRNNRLDLSVVLQIYGQTKTAPKAIMYWRMNSFGTVESWKTHEALD